MLPLLSPATTFCRPTDGMLSVLPSPACSYGKRCVRPCLEVPCVWRRFAVKLPELLAVLPVLCLLSASALAAAKLRPHNLCPNSTLPVSLSVGQQVEYGRTRRCEFFFASSRSPAWVAFLQATLISCLHPCPCAQPRSCHVSSGTCPPRALAAAKLYCHSAAATSCTASLLLQDEILKAAVMK